MKYRLALTYLFVNMGLCAYAQDKPQDILKAELPKSAVCVICQSTGDAHGPEKPVAGMRYKNKSFYFCSLKEVSTFKKDPESYLPPVLPRPAPSLNLKTVEDNVFTTDLLKGKVILVDFWSTTCVPCVAAMPDMQKLFDKFQGKGFVVVGVSIDEEGSKKVKPFLNKRKFTYPILLDTNGDSPRWKAFGVHAIPAIFLINRHGQIVQQWTGKTDKKDIEKVVSMLIGEEKSE